MLVGVPPAVVDPSEHAEQVDRVDAATPGDAVLAVGREREVVRGERSPRADLGGLLAEQRGPQAQLALALECGGLGVEAADEDEVAVEAAQVLIAQLGEDRVELAVGDPLTLGGEHLDHLGTALGERPVGRPRMVRLGRARLMVVDAHRRGQRDVVVAHVNSFSRSRS